MTYTITQETIRDKYISLECRVNYDRATYKVATATECGMGYREDKSNTYTDLKKARATYNRYRREAKRG